VDGEVTPERKAEAITLIGLVQQAADKGYTPEQFLKEMTPALGGPEGVKALSQVHPDMIIQQTEAAAGERFRVGAKHLIRDSLRRARELQTETE